MSNSLGNLLGATDKNRRREAREEVDDGTVEIDGRNYPVINWSAHGFMAKPCDVAYGIADKLDVKIAIHFASETIEFECAAIVVRLDKKKQELGAALVVLDNAVQLAIAKHFGDSSTSIDRLLGDRS